MKFPHPKLQIVCFAVLLAFASITANAQDSMERWQNFDFAKSALKPADVTNVPLEDLTLMRGNSFDGTAVFLRKTRRLRLTWKRRIRINPTLSFKTQC